MDPQNDNSPKSKPSKPVYFFVEPDESALPTDLDALDQMAASLDQQIAEVAKQLEAAMAPPKPELAAINCVDPKEATTTSEQAAKAASAADKNVSSSFFVEPDESSLPTDLGALDQLAAELDKKIAEVAGKLEAELNPPKRKKRPTTGTKTAAPKETPNLNGKELDQTVS